MGVIPSELPGRIWQPESQRPDLRHGENRMSVDFSAKSQLTTAAADDTIYTERASVDGRREYEAENQSSNKFCTNFLASVAFKFIFD